MKPYDHGAILIALCLLCTTRTVVRSAVLSKSLSGAAAAPVLTVVTRSPTVTPHNMSLDETEDVLTLTCTVGYNNFGAVFWTLYDRDLRDIGHVEETNSMMDDGHTMAKVSVLRIGGWQVLPTDSGVYPFKCNTFADFKVGSDTAVVRTQLTDTCGHDSNPGKCEARGALCVNSHCACVDERHPLKLPSVHTVCWPEVRLGARCYFKEQCSAAHSECVVSLGWCACSPGYARSPDLDKCEPKPEGGIRSRCARHADCTRFNARCVYSHCECSQETIAPLKDSLMCVNATVVPLPAPPVSLPWAVAPRTALQQEAQQLAPEGSYFGQPHKHIRDAPITDD